MANKRTPAKEGTLVIYYKKLVSCNRPETFKGIKDPDRIISKRDVRNILKINFGGQPYDFTKFLNRYETTPSE